MQEQAVAQAQKIAGQEHWTTRGGAKLFLWEKCIGDPARAKGTVLFVHGSSMASCAIWACYSVKNSNRCANSTASAKN